MLSLSLCSSSKSCMKEDAHADMPPTQTSFQRINWLDLGMFRELKAQHNENFAHSSDAPPTPDTKSGDHVMLSLHKVLIVKVCIDMSQTIFVFLSDFVTCKKGGLCAGYMSNMDSQCRATTERCCLQGGPGDPVWQG